MHLIPPDSRRMMDGEPSRIGEQAETRIRNDEQIRELAETEWSDVRLIEAIRGDPPDDLALDMLVQRYWRALFGRCQLLTQDAELARDLAQDAWHRLLRARRGLDPHGNFPGYLSSIATNLWRDGQRSARRAGPLASNRTVSLNASLQGDIGDPVALIDALPDPNALDPEDQAQLRIDIDHALSQLSPQVREVVLARYLDGESAAEIGRRFGRTEQTITGWLRQGIVQMRAVLETPRRDASRHG